MPVLDRIRGLFRPAARKDPAPAGRDARAEVVKVLTEELGAGYRRGAVVDRSREGSAATPDLADVMVDVEAMLSHPRVSICLSYYKAGIAGAEFEMEDASSPEVGAFALGQLERFWQRSRVQAQRAYEYGRGGYQILYEVEDGRLVYDGLRDYFPPDCRVLTKRQEYVGIRVRNVENKGTLDLWGPQRVPAKAFWYSHNRRYNPWYGLTQLYAAWRPWRRLAGRDGAEEFTDGGFYRFAFPGPVVRYPMEDTMPRPGSYGVDGKPLTNRDKAREFGENAKAGVSVCLSSRRDEHGNYVWDVIWPERAFDGAPLLNYIEGLETAISLGIGVPPELLEASEVGSGYSGRMIPLEGFFTGQQFNADSLVTAWQAQIGDPLVRWNYGPDAWFRIKVKNLLESKMRQQQGAQQPPQPEQPGQPEQPEQPTPPNARGMPYVGPRGGQGFRDPKTDAVRYEG